MPPVTAAADVDSSAADVFAYATTMDLTVQPLTGSTSRLTIAVDFEGHGIGKILVPLIVRRQARNEMPANIAALKRRIEAMPHPPGP